MRHYTGRTEDAPATPMHQRRPKESRQGTAYGTVGEYRNRRRPRCPFLKPPRGPQTRLNLGRERHLFGIDLTVRIDNAPHRPHEGGRVAFSGA